MRPHRSLAALGAVAVLALTGCGDGQDAGSTTLPSSTPDTTLVPDDGETEEKRFPDVETVDIRREADGTFTLDVTISSTYDSPERYADGWRVLTTDGTELGSHELAHDHAGEQPFTRTQSGLAIPDGVTEVIVEGRDSENGYGGTSVRAAVPAP
ncbi:hypothetical protein JQN72_15775 [Phycicoccus sp. CSK15P-2]|uniref:hypothetical protein n=1 Tax=Phycicoccus sp. CSK15P-2 TaxID=2807627 RepID=UPI00194E610B|nr:hypothetical protein [Phycicoccus sp. CSK15P-2]MBM6405701.1 hypothetical protein [Phycicoccus sp. CSK15P-2]